MITIDQLLESVDLDFEPRWVTKDMMGRALIWEKEPTQTNAYWTCGATGKFTIYEQLKLSEFDGKDWTECIYEVPRKTTGKIEKLERHIRVENGYEISCPPDETEIIEKINLLIDAVNELKGAKFDELLVQADKVERLQKAVDLALDAFGVMQKTMLETGNYIQSSWIENTTFAIKQLIKENQ